MDMRSVIAKCIWTCVILVALVDILMYLKRKHIATESCTNCTPPTPGVMGEVPHPYRGTVGMGEGEIEVGGTRNTSTVDCRPLRPCSYPEQVDFRVIVMSFNRAQSLGKLLKSLDGMEMDGDKGMLEVWIDRNKKGEVDSKTLATAGQFHWSKGGTRVHVQQEHVGIYGQWIDSYRPRTDTREIALILEDDLSVSPYTYRWLKAARDKYGSRKDIAGYTLQSEGVSAAKGSRAITAPRTDTAFLYKLLGSWGFSPHPVRWAEFQDWYHVARKDINFHPYVNGLRMTTWYKSFEKQHTQDSMWTMWHIYYCDKHDLYTVYNNIVKAGAIKEGYLSQNRREPGLHFGGTGIEAHRLLTKWNNTFTSFPDHPVMLEFDGNHKK